MSYRISSFKIAIEYLIEEGVETHFPFICKIPQIV
jgi:hypothetical protein